MVERNVWFLGLPINLIFSIWFASKKINFFSTEMSIELQIIERSDFQFKIWKRLILNFRFWENCFFFFVSLIEATTILYNFWPWYFHLIKNLFLTWEIVLILLLLLLMMFFLVWLWLSRHPSNQKIIVNLKILPSTSYFAAYLWTHFIEELCNLIFWQKPWKTNNSPCFYIPVL